MADSVLSLGGYSFSEFEVPSSITFGGSHRLSIKEMLGDVRIIDALGSSEDDISWEGWLLGGDAISRAQTLDSMRYGGQQQSLTIFDLFYNVIIEKFNFRVERGYQISYNITLKVISNLNQQSFLQDIVDFTGAILSDLNQASGILNGLNINNPTLASNISSLSSSVSSVNNFAKASSGTINGISSSVTNTLGSINSQINTVKARLF